MMIQVSLGEVISAARQTLSLPDSKEPLGSDLAYWSASVRRLAGFTCPCSPTTLTSTLVESHKHVFGDIAVLKDLVAGVVDSLIARGDLLELENSSTSLSGAKQTWVYAAPPAFVKLASGDAILVGLSSDDQTPLPSNLKAKVIMEGSGRRLASGVSGGFSDVLNDLGFRELSIDAWLRMPKPQTAEALRSSMSTLLAGQTASGEIDGAKIMIGGGDTKFYRDRWASISSQTGLFVIRRPQDYGAAMWGYAELSSGRVTRLLNLPLPTQKCRGCDAAWYLQMATDALNGAPQSVQVTYAEDECRLDFNAPIPSWAQRRLITLGRQVPAQGCLLSFSIRKADGKAEIKFLEERLFLTSR